MEKRNPPAPNFDRRRLLGFVGAAVVFAIYYFGFYKPRLKHTVKHSVKMMGTIVNFTVIGKDEKKCKEAIDLAIAHMEKVAAVINWYDPKSPLSILNKTGRIENPPPVLLEVVRMAKETAELTKGAFDPTVLPLLTLYRQIKSTGVLPPKEETEKLLPLIDYKNVLVEKNIIRYATVGMGMTLDGIGKGYVVDQGVKKLNELGFPDICVEAGGDLMVTGVKDRNKPWTIGIRNPRPEKEGEQYIITMQDRAIATSGDYMQAYTEDRTYHHIINPATGFSPPELASASIIAPSVARADGLATAAMVMGHEKAITLLDSLPDCEGFLIGKDLETHTSKNFFT